MKTTVTSIQQLVRLAGVLQIVLGLLFWAGFALGFVGLHMLLGMLLVLLLWTLAGMAAWARVSPALAALAVAWGLGTPVLGMTQAQLLPGAAHWVVQVAHFLVGLVALALAETLARRLRDRHPVAGELQGAIG
jgi:predicted ferric reductase